MGERERRLSNSSNPRTATVPELPPTERNSSRTLLIALFSVIGFIVIITAAALASYQMVYAQRIPLGVQVLDMDIGGLEPAKAKALISDNLDAYLRTPMVLRDEGREWKVLPGELGASYDVDETVAQAQMLGQEGWVLDKIQRQISYLQSPQRVDLKLVFNDTAFQGGLSRLAKDVERSAQDASIQLAGAEVAMSPSRPGSQIDRVSFKTKLNEAFSTLSAPALDVPVQTISPGVKEEDLAPARKQIEGVLSAPITVKYGDKKWALEKTALAQMVTFQQSKDASGAIKVQTAVSSEKAADWAKKIANEVDQEAMDARVIWNAGRLTVSNPGRSGLTVEIAKLGGLLNSALAKGDRVIDLPVMVKQPAGAGDLNRLGIKEKIAEASTSYAGTLADRIYNVKLGAERINGKVVPPGGVYSMAEALGPITEGSGYKLGFAIVGQDTVLDVGGGLSQLTTTVFKAAFTAGFPIIERTTHSYRIRRYEPILGIEATVYPPYVDLKFKNDTDHHIVIDARTDAGNVSIAIFGTRPNREVIIEEPIIQNIVPTDRTVIRKDYPLLPKGTEITSEVAEDGLDVTNYRVIKVDGKEVKRERFFVRFRPSHNVVLVGTKE